MSSTKSSSQQSTTDRRRTIVNNAASKKYPPTINITASIHNTSTNPPRSTVLKYPTNSRRITYASSSVDARPSRHIARSEPVPRVPLQHRDRNHNARPVTTSSRTDPCAPPVKPSYSTGRLSKMAPIGGGSDRPRQPQLAAKPLRPPLTPKVASKSSHSQPVTPLGRRIPNQAPAVASLATAKEEAASPLASFISHNITPRSGSRQSRVESTNTTPSGTPVPERTSEGWVDSPKLAGLGVSVPATDSGKNSLQGSAVGEPVDSKFFYASDARSTQNQNNLPAQRPAAPANKSPSTFFYANGTSANNSNQNQHVANAVYSSTTAAASEPSVSKFFYANGTPDVPVRAGLPHSGSGSTVSTSSRVPYMRPTTSSSTVPTAMAPIISRPASPIKAASTSNPQTLRSNTSPPTPALAPPAVAPAPRHVDFRRDSVGSSTQRNSRGHSRTGSIPTIESITASRLTQSPTSPGTVSPLPSPGLAPPALTMANIMQAVDAIGEEEEDSRPSEIPPGLASPTKSVRNDPLNELVVNARRERKVQDLEITNASLEAINRTLERQLRKQTAELRRYRRLSRSGRLSLASVASSRVTSGASTVQGGLPDLSEEEYSDEEQDSTDEDDLSSPGSLSGDDPLLSEERVLSRRKRDEKRLELDLSKHQELLIDSQKINQSIKRCLDWTEVLIKEGKKALDYHVRVSEVELGGRVLVPEDEEDEASQVGYDANSGDPSRRSLERIDSAGVDDDQDIQLDGG